MTASILVADGTATTRIQMKVRLASACYDVLTAVDCDDFVRLLRGARPDIILIGSAFLDMTQAGLCQLARQFQPLVPILGLAGTAGRVAALRGGATAVLGPDVEDQMLLARIRGLLRDAGQGFDTQLAEAPAAFVHAPGAAPRPIASGSAPEGTAGSSVTLVADGVARALRWRNLLQTRLDCTFRISTPEDALAAAARGQVSDLYLIAADIGMPEDGLRLMSELRSRTGTRAAAYIVATAPERDTLAAMALDLGAGDVVPLDLGGNAAIDVAAIAIRGQLARKSRQDQLRSEARQTLHYAMTDPLTGLHNRRYAMPKLCQMAYDAASRAQSFAVLILDLDRFKSVNDRHGHAAGDAVLHEIARRIGTVMQSQGLTCRLGGEEFLIALPRGTAASACRLAEVLRHDISAVPIILPHLSGGGTIVVTVSIGVAVCDMRGHTLHSADLVDLALERADRALITAKSLGRNRVMLAQAEHAA